MTDRAGTGSQRWMWPAVQAAGLTFTLVLLVGLYLAPEPTLSVFWKVVIPLVPASLLVSPLLWRNACPLATLNMLSNGSGGRRLGGRAVAVSSAVGIVLLLTLVPARRFLFNANGPALATTILAVAALAVLMGVAFQAKAGFCSSMCPVLPVERLYGQRPLVRIGNGRCAACTLCAHACVDLSPEKSLRQLLGRRRHSAAWLGTPFGLFAAAFPGFVVGYFTTADVPLTGAAATYGHIALWAGASLLLALGLVRIPGVGFERLVPTLAASAAGLYYWFASPDLAVGLGLGPAVGPHLRVALLALVVAWWLRAVATSSGKVVNGEGTSASFAR